MSENTKPQQYKRNDVVYFRLKSDNIIRLGNITMASSEVYLIYEDDEGDNGEVHRVLPEEIVSLEYRTEQ